MTREEKDKYILKLYDKRLSYLKGEISEESYFSYVDKNINKISTSKKGYKDINAKVNAAKKYINNYFRSVTSLDNIDKLNELKRLEKEFNNQKKRNHIANLDTNLEYLYKSFIDYCRGISNTEEENDNKFLDILDSFDYKSIDPSSRITKKNAFSTKFKFFRENACCYYVKKNNKKRVDFFKYIKTLEEQKKIKYLKKERFNEDKYNEIRELLYSNYIQYLNDLISETKLINLAKKNNIDLFSTSDNGYSSSAKILKAIEFQSNIYAREVLGNLDIINYLKKYGPLVTRLKKEGKLPLYNEDEIKIIKDIYSNFINYYDMNVYYNDYIKNEIKLVESINNNRLSYSNKKDSKYFINYYIKNVLNNNITMDSIINNSKLYNKCFIIFRDFSYNKIDDNIKEFIDNYRVNIYNCAYLFAKENDLLDLFNEMDKRRKDILAGTYIDEKEIDYKELVNKFINSNLYLDDFIIEEEIDKKEFLDYVKYLKVTNDKLYVKYNSSIIGNKTKKDKYINNRINGLYELVNKGIPSSLLNKNREFKLLDFYLYVDKFLFDIDRFVFLSKNVLLDKMDNDKYFDLLKSIRSNNNYINKDNLYNINISYKGNTISREDINYILEYMNKYNMPLTMKLFSEVLIRYFDNNLLDLGEDIIKIKNIPYKNIEFYENEEEKDISIIPRLGEDLGVEEFKIIKNKYGYKVKGIKNIDSNYKLIKSSKDNINKLLNKIIKDYNIIIDLDDNSDKISLITKYTTYNSDNKYACELCSFESNISTDFMIYHLLDEDVHELYNTCCLCKDCYEKINGYNEDKKIKLLVNVRNRIESRLNEYLDSFDKYILIDNFDKIAYSLFNNKE